MRTQKLVLPPVNRVTVLEKVRAAMQAAERARDYQALSRLHRVYVQLGGPAKHNRPSS